MALVMSCGPPPPFTSISAKAAGLSAIPASAALAAPLGSGAPERNQNALKHGVFTKEAIDERREVRALIVQSRELLEELK
jgi:hypothetical protein